MPDEYVVLVDEQDQAIGQLEKMEAHRMGLLHRAFSVLIFNTKGELLLQQRAAHKYHSPLLWTNSCCSHPKPGETITAAATRRLQEEMGMSAQLKAAFHFIYKAKLDQGLTEHELDHVVIGYTKLTLLSLPDSYSESPNI
jgi:isopentenyl-diphosphate delta-isomerase